MDADADTTRIADRALEAVVAELAAPAPAASGGAASAVVGAMAASLVVMVGRGSPAWAEGAVSSARAEKLRDELLSLADEDVRAFRGVLAAVRNAPPERQELDLSAALVEAARPPLAVAAASAEVARLAAVAATEGKGAMRADAAVAATLARAASEAAVLTVEANVAHLELDERFPEARELLASARAVR